MTFNVVPELEEWYCQATLINDRGLIERTHVEVYRIESTDFVVPFVAQSQVPSSQFDVYAYDPSARLRDMTTRFDPRKKDPYVYRTVKKYTTSCPDQEQQNIQQDNPLDDEPEIDIDGEVVLVPAFKDRDDKMICNTANQPIAGVEEERAIEVMTITRNESTRNTARDRLFRNTVNLTTWNGADPGTAKITRIKAQRQYRNGIKFFRYIYEVRYNEKGWQPKILNAGTMQLVGGDFKACLDKDLQPVTEPVPLAGDGSQIATADLPDDAVYLNFNTLRATEFDNLGLPTSD